MRVNEFSERYSLPRFFCRWHGTRLQNPRSDPHCEDCAGLVYGLSRCGICDQFCREEDFSHCGICEKAICEECTFECCETCGGYCERFMPCELCDILYCRECQGLFVCSECGNAYCSVVCQDSFFCKACQGHFCRECKDSCLCTQCDDEFCVDCRETVTCNTHDCDNTFCSLKCLGLSDCCNPSKGVLGKRRRT
jgi:hypothetical protein